MDYEVVMTSKYEIYFRKLFGQLDVVIFHHMSEGDDHVAFLSLQEIDHVLGKLQEGKVFNDFIILREQSINPLFFSQAKYPDFSIPSFKDPILFTVNHSFIGSFVEDVAAQPREVGGILELHHMIIGVV